MRLCFIDTEFTDFINTELISLGAVTEDGKHEFYCELNDYNRKASSEFVSNVVEPLLDIDKFGMSKTQASARLFCWLEELGDEYVICPDYSGDWQILVDLLEEFPCNINKQPVMLHTYLNQLATSKAKELQTPDYKWFFDTAQKHYSTGFLEYFLKNPIPKQHHALADAKANRYGYLKCVNWLNSHGY